jgi:hypothetical protein
MVNLLITGSGRSGLSDVGNQPSFMFHGNGNADSYQFRGLSIQRPSLVAGSLELCVCFPDFRKLGLKVVEELGHVTLRFPFACEELVYTEIIHQFRQLPMPVQPVILLLLLLLPIATVAETLSGRVVRVVDGDTLYVLDAKNKGTQYKLVLLLW